MLRRNPFSAFFETRSIGPIADFVDYLRGGLTNTTGSPVTESSAMRISTFETCVDLKSRTVASLPFGVFQRDGANKVPLPNHWLQRVMAKPNPWQTQFELTQTLQVYLDIYKNSYAWINWVGSGRDTQAAELIPLHPSSIEVEQNDEFRQPVYWHTSRKGTRTAMPAREILHLKGLSTNGAAGRSYLADGRDVIGRAQVQDEHAGKFWRGGGRPAVILEHPKTLSPNAKNNLETSFEETYGSSPDQRRVAVIEEGMAVKFPDLSNEASQFLDTRNYSRAEIAAHFHVPGFMAGLEEKSTSWGTGIEQQQIGFLTFTIAPDLVLWEKRIAKSLLGDDPKTFVKFNEKAVLRADAKTQAEYFRILREACGFSANDILALLDMNPISAADGGDMRFRPANWLPLNAPASLAPVAAPGVSA